MATCTKHKKIQGRRGQVEGVWVSFELFSLISKEKTQNQEAKTPKLLALGYH